MEIDYGMTGVLLDEETGLKNYPVWAADFAHAYPPWSPLYAFNFLHQGNQAFHRAPERLSIPTSKGFEWRLYNGMVYITVEEPAPEEIPGREKLFGERMAEFIENPEEKWTKDREWLMQRYKPIQEANIEKVSLLQLQDFFFSCCDLTREVHEIHFYWMYGLYLINRRFTSACEELAHVSPEDPIHQKLRGGFDNLLFDINKKIWLLGDEAREMGLADLFLATSDSEELLSKLEDSPQGRKWLGNYLDFLKVHGWRCPRLMEWADPSWVEKPSLGLPDVRLSIDQGGAFTLDKNRARKVLERQQAEKELMSKVPPAEAGWFTKLLKMAQMSGWWTEDHTPVVEFCEDSVPRKVVLEIGRRFANAGVIDEISDIFMLLPWEISKSIFTMRGSDLRRLARWRRGEWEKACRMDHVPFLGNVERFGELVAKDPVMGVVVPTPKVRPELQADLYGSASTLGIAEGFARVIRSGREIDQVQPGEILVAPTTESPWVSVFHLVKGVVTDMGGAVAHAVIVGREFGLPVVAGTMEATSKIKTGQRIRVDGDNCAVYLLDK